MAVADEASTGEEALEKALEKQYDVIVLDIAMPGRGGLDVLKQIRSQKPKLPVLVLSMYPEDQYALCASGTEGRCGWISYQGKRP
jgi:YesN/AraC family two-component response regulator